LLDRSFGTIQAAFDTAPTHQIKCISQNTLTGLRQVFKAATSPDVCTCRVISNHPAAADVAKTIHIAVIRCTAKTMYAIFKNQALLSQVFAVLQTAFHLQTEVTLQSHAGQVYVKTAFLAGFFQLSYRSTKILTH